MGAADPRADHGLLPGHSDAGPGRADLDHLFSVTYEELRRLASRRPR